MNTGGGNTTFHKILMLSNTDFIFFNQIIFEPKERKLKREQREQPKSIKWMYSLFNLPCVWPWWPMAEPSLPIIPCKQNTASSDACKALVFMHRQHRPPSCVSQDQTWPLLRPQTDPSTYSWSLLYKHHPSEQSINSQYVSKTVLLMRWTWFVLGG